jgi:hypothetical protein
VKSIKIAVLVCAAAVAASVFWGCAGDPDPNPDPNPDPVSVPVQDAVQPELEPESDSVFPLQPIDEDIVNQVLESGDSLKRLQYYISGEISLIKENVIQNVEIRNGAGLRRETSATGQILIRKETAGILVNTFFDEARRRVFAVSFDEASPRDTLFFRWNGDTRRFVLDYDADSRLTGYGDQKYRLRFTGETPHLLIRFSEEKTDNPYERVVQGRFIRFEN